MSPVSYSSSLIGPCWSVSWCCVSRNVAFVAQPEGEIYLSMYSNSQLWSPVVKRSESWLKDCFLSAHLDSETDQGAQRVTATSCWKDPPEVVQHLNRILLTPPIGGFLGRTGQLPRADQHSVEGLFIPSDRRSSSKSRRWFCADNSYKCLRLVRASFQCWSFYFFFSVQN